VTGIKGSKEKRKRAVEDKVVQLLQVFCKNMAAPADDIPTIVQYSVTFKTT